VNYFLLPYIQTYMNVKGRETVYKKPPTLM